MQIWLEMQQKNKPKQNKQKKPLYKILSYISESCNKAEIKLK